jgi:hypothetical protein
MSRLEGSVISVVTATSIALTVGGLGWFAASTLTRLEGRDVLLTSQMEQLRADVERLEQALLGAGIAHP